MNKYFLPALFLFILLSCKKEVVIFDAAPNADFELPLLLELNGKACFYDEPHGLLKYSLEVNALESFSPHTHFQEYSTVIFDGKALKNNETNHLGAIQLNKRYSLDITTNGQTRHLQLEFTDLPLIRIVTFDQITNEPKTLAKMTVNYAEQNKPAVTEWIGIELRGATSLSFDKKSYGFVAYSDKSTEHSVSHSYFGLPENSRWILDAMYVDKGRCRNKTSFSLWSSLGETSDHPNIRSVFTEVFLNNESVGLYCFDENYSEELLDLDQQSVLYKGLDNSEATFFNALPGKKPVSAVWGEWEQKYPDPSDRIEWDDFEALSKLIVNGSDAEFTQAIGTQMDLGNVIDYYLFINLCDGIDNMGKNWYFLKRSPSGKFLLAPWDLDATWGRNVAGNPQPAKGVLTNHFFDRLNALNPDNYNQRLRQRWNELRADQFSEAQLFGLFSENFSALNHFHILETENALWSQSLSSDLEQAYIESWIVNRLAYLDAAFQ